MRRVLIALALASGASLSATSAQAEAVTINQPGAEVVAIDRLGAAAPVLWDGGVAWLDPEGIRAATPGAASQALVSFKALGFTYGFALDSGSGSDGAGSPGGALAYGWEEANEMTPPMGPGDTSIPAPALPYETSISHRGVIGADGHVIQLPACGTEDLPVPFGAYEVSLGAGDTVAYRCEGVAPGAQAPKGAILPSYLALSDVATPASTARTIPASSLFQISGEYLAYDTAGTTDTPGKPGGSSRVVVENWKTGTVVYEVPPAAQEGPIGTIALQQDGTLVLLGAGTSACATPRARSGQTYPAEWFSPASPVAHQLGCFYDGSLRPVGGQWVALRSGPAGAEASLVLLDLATGSSRTLAVFANAAVFEPQQQPLTPGADFDGKQLAWTQQTCAGRKVQLTPDIGAMSPGPPSSPRCPVLFHIHGALHPTAEGAVRIGVSCPLGCPLIELSIAQPRALRAGPAFISLPASPGSSIESLRLSRRQRAYLGRHRRVRVTLVALSSGLGSAPQTKFAAHAVLAR